MRRPMVLSLQATASKSLCGRENEKCVIFMSSMVLQSIMTFSSCQQNDQKCMKPQFQWFRCCTHVWPSMEDVNLSFFCADKRQVYLRRHCHFYWLNNLREEHKTLEVKLPTIWADEKQRWKGSERRERLEERRVEEKESEERRCRCAKR